MECGVRNIFVKHHLFHHFNNFFLDVNLKCEDCSILNSSGYFYLGGGQQCFSELGTTFHKPDSDYRDFEECIS